MARYTFVNTYAGTKEAMTTTYKTLASLTSATGATTLRRAWIFDVSFGTDGTPGDTQMLYTVDRQTTVGTASAAVPNPLDPSDAAALITANVNNTVEPTITVDTAQIEVPIYQRGSYRWTTIPGGGGELVVPAINANGLGARAKSAAYTGTVTCAIQFYE